MVSRLCATIEGTTPGHLAECLGLDASKYKGSNGGMGGSGGGHGGGWVEADLIGTGVALDDDSNFIGLDPLTLTLTLPPSAAAPASSSSSSGGVVHTFPYLGVSQVLLGKVAPDALLSPPEDLSVQLSPAQLANQATLRSVDTFPLLITPSTIIHSDLSCHFHHRRAREAIVKYYDCTLKADDAMAGNIESRDVVLRPLTDLSAEGGRGGGDCCPHPDPAKAAMGVTMHRVVNEKNLYLQLSSYYREMDVAGAVKRVVSQLRASDPRNAPREAEVASRVSVKLRQALGPAARQLLAMKEASGYHWVSLGEIFGVEGKTGGQQAAA